jgi:outer membrane protein assembly factor BamE (lipoprotein component of BamABCDE complex)
MIRADGRNILGKRGLALGGAALALVMLAGCTSSKTGLVANSRISQHGYIISPLALEQVPVGSSREQVLIALGTPSTTAQFSNEVFYYFSQTRRQPARFMNSKVVDQQVLAVYFDKNNKVSRIAHYGLKDGQVFDFVTRTTATGGADQSFLQSVFSTNNLKPKLPGT